jgi:amino acid permease
MLLGTPPGFNSFSPTLSPSTFFSNYSSPIIFALIWIGCKLKRVDSAYKDWSWGWIATDEMDFASELEVIRYEGERGVEDYDYTKYDRIMNRLF